MLNMHKLDDILSRTTNTCRPARTINMAQSSSSNEVDDDSMEQLERQMLLAKVLNQVGQHHGSGFDLLRIQHGATNPVLFDSPSSPAKRLKLSSTNEKDDDHLQTTEKHKSISVSLSQMEDVAGKIYCFN